MAAPLVATNQPYRVHYLGEERIAIQDKTSELAISIAGFPPYQLLWKGVPCFLATLDGRVVPISCGTEPFSNGIEVIEGAVPGKPWILIKSPEGKDVATLELNTRLCASKKIDLSLVQLCFIAHEFAMPPLSDPATVKVVEEFPGIDDSSLSASDRDLLNQTVSGAMRSSPAHELLLSENLKYREIFTAKKKRFSRFDGGTPFYDCTANAIAKTLFLGFPFSREEITLNGFPLLDVFQENGEFVGLGFSPHGPGNVNYVVVRDRAENSVVIELVKRLLPGQITPEKKHCVVDLDPSNIWERHPSNCPCAAPPDSEKVYRPS